MILFRFVLVAGLIFTIPIYGNSNCYAKHSEQNEHAKISKKESLKKHKRRAYISGFFAVSSLLALVGVITGKALSDTKVMTVDSPDPIFIDKMDGSIFTQYEHLNIDYDFSYNKLSDTCKDLDQGLYDIQEKYKDDKEVQLDADVFRNTLFNDKCRAFVPNPEGIELPEYPYSTKDIHAHLDGFAIQLISLTSAAIISGGFLAHYLTKASKDSKAVKREQKAGDQNPEMQCDEENPDPNGMQGLEARPRSKKGHALTIMLGGALACAANSMAGSLYPHRSGVPINSDLFTQNGEPGVFSHFNGTHHRYWNDIVALSEQVKQIDEQIGQIEDLYSQDDHGFGMVIASDPQLPWGRKDDTNVTDQEWIESGIETNRYHTSSMNQLKKLGDDFGKVQSVIMNGDLTAYAHPWQWVLYKRLYDNNTEDSYPEALTMPVYPGLGNHDYENNVNSCWGPWYSVLIDQKNWCAKNAMNQIKRDLADVEISSFDEGSLSYSWDIEHIHFVQLHNYPSYTSSSIGIEDSLEWLDHDLNKAQSEGRMIVINFHIQKFTPELKSIFKKYNIIGVFVGHYHRLIGRRSKIDTSLGESSVYYSGSASYNLFNYVYFSDHKMVVYSIDSSTGEPVIKERYTQVYN